MPGRIRAFIALEVDDELRQEMQVVQDQFRQARPQMKWVAPELCHLTLKFLGMVNQQQLDDLSATCRQVAEEAAPFYLNFEGLGAFPNIRNIRVLWMGISDGEADLIQLQQRLEQAVEPLGFPSESRPFQPHLTLGRLKEPLSRAQMLFFNDLIDGYGGFRFGYVPVTSMHLIRSVLSPTGPVYTVLERYQLAGAGTAPLELSEPLAGEETEGNLLPLEGDFPDEQAPSA